MKPEIASIHERMAKGGDWHTWREEIAALHEKATTEEEYVTLLRAHEILVEVGRHAFDADTYEKLLPIARAEYMWFLSREAMEGGELVNPIMLDRITAREVEAGRMEPDDDYREFARAGGEVMGDSSDMRYDRKLGDRIGIAGVVLGALAFFLISKPLGIVVFVAGMGAGWFINERRKKQALERAQLDRAARGYA